MHIVRYTFDQAHFSTPTVGHWAVAAVDGKAADAMMRAIYPDWVKIEYIASLTR